MSSTPTAEQVTYDIEDNCGTNIQVLAEIVIITCDTYNSNRGLLTIYNIEDMSIITTFSGVNEGDQFGN